ncbi:MULTISPECIES: GH25 family lysozyme [unclassified Brachybacterium]|uniref:GH25 family lysozyme n=1 Tax=unclassified Brachybacterium TaxID=2623841 RepID=UPI000C80324B|nr:MULTISPECIES: GH25 family lysozyme [unclassified Brachybacterium]PMC75999.1 lysozyme [Brachybacterium sp. UMB0905]
MFPTTRSFDRRSFFAATAALGGGAAALTLPATMARAEDTAIRGQDVSSHQGNVDWAAQAAAGSRFAYCKATQGNWYKNPYFSQQYGGSYEHGLVHGAYHWTEPGNSDPVAECDFFVDNGGGWSDDGRTMPGMLDVEDNPNGMGMEELQGWIVAWIDRYRERTGRTPVVYTGAWFWDAQVGPNWAPENVPLHVAAYTAEPPVGTQIPGTWNAWEIWQYNDSGAFAGDQNLWHGNQEQFEAFLVDPNYDPVSN